MQGALHLLPQAQPPQVPSLPTQRTLDRAVGLPPYLPFPPLRQEVVTDGPLHRGQERELHQKQIFPHVLKPQGRQAYPLRPPQTCQEEEGKDREEDPAPHRPRRACPRHGRAGGEEAGGGEGGEGGGEDGGGEPKPGRGLWQHGVAVRELEQQGVGLQQQQKRGLLRQLQRGDREVY